MPERINERDTEASHIAGVRFDNFPIPNEEPEYIGITRHWRTQRVAAFLPRIVRNSLRDIWDMGYDLKNGDPYHPSTSTDPSNPFVISKKEQ